MYVIWSPRVHEADQTDRDQRSRNARAMREDGYSTTIDNNSSEQHKFLHLIHADWFCAITVAGALALLVWEYFITFDDEVNLIWRSVSHYILMHLSAIIIQHEPRQETEWLVHKVALPLHALLRDRSPDVRPTTFVPKNPSLDHVLFSYAEEIRSCRCASHHPCL